MTKEEAIKIIKDRTPISRIIGVYDCGNFYEVIGKAGGDTLTYRVYRNGTITED